MSKMESDSSICRVRRTKEQAKASYTRMSPLYDLFGSFEEKHMKEGLQALGVKEGEQVLEIGFGTGHGILSLAEAVGDKGKVYGIDISEGMCSITWNRVKKAGLTERVKLRCGDAAQLPFPDGLFDAVFMSFTLDLIDTPEIPVVLGECKRVLRKGGRICVVAMSRKGKPSMLTRLYEIFHEMLPTLVDCRPIYVEQSLAEAGFKILQSKDISLFGLRGERVVAQKNS